MDVELARYAAANPPARAKYGDTMGKTVPDMARLSWSALVEQARAQMVSPYFGWRHPSAHSPLANRNT
jgi:lysyl-tRNA synthetase class II